MKKKIFISLSILNVILYACTGGSDKKSESGDTSSHSTESSVTEKEEDHVATAEAPGAILIAKSDCMGCHNKDQKMIGPSYKDVAKRYELNEENVAKLADKIVKGSKGDWGQVPMTAHPTISMEDAKEMTRYILSLRK